MTDVLTLKTVPEYGKKKLSIFKIKSINGV